MLTRSYQVLEIRVRGLFTDATSDSIRELMLHKAHSAFVVRFEFCVPCVARVPVPKLVLRNRQAAALVCNLEHHALFQQHAQACGRLGLKRAVFLASEVELARRWAARGAPYSLATASL